ncbi:MAG: N-acetyltransferase, partial [Ilumatobacteraceae bacterium]
MATRISDDAQIAGDATIGDGTQVWNLVQIREGAAIGRDCIVGRAA